MSKPTQEEIESVERNYWVELYNDLESLEKDPRFQRLILEGYFKDRAVNAVSMLAVDSVKKQGQRTDIMEDLISISNLQEHFIMIKNLGSTSKDDLDQIDGLEE